MIVGSDGRFAFITEDRPATTEHRSADRTPEIPEPKESAGQMFMIRRSIEALLEKGEPLRMLKPTQAWRRITGHLEGTGIEPSESRISAPEARLHRASSMTDMQSRSTARSDGDTPVDMPAAV
jgi:hypothetical protein